MDDLTGAYEELPFAYARTATTDTLRMAATRHHVPVLVEIDVTAAREAIGRHKREGDDLSFTAWAVKCVAQAAGEHRRVHAVRHGRRKLVVFADVDVALAVYRRLDGDDTDERLPMPYVVRRAQTKDVAQLSREVRDAQTGRWPAANSGSTARRRRPGCCVSASPRRSTCASGSIGTACCATPGG